MIRRVKVFYRVQFTVVVTFKGFPSIRHDTKHIFLNPFY